MLFPIALLISTAAALPLPGSCQSLFFSVLPSNNTERRLHGGHIAGFCDFYDAKMKTETDWFRTDLVFIQEAYHHSVATYSDGEMAEDGGPKNVLTKQAVYKLFTGRTEKPEAECANGPDGPFAWGTDEDKVGTLNCHK
ncbi:hypothetical protein CJU89_5715 [Yarrowia sp. B02]|nr:hypothetical protein CJU89_5715 [Yarrowia sp. B02]